MITFDRVSRLFPNAHAALSDVSFEIGAGEFVIVTGPSGAGKTTMMQMVYREQVPTTGRVVVAGLDVRTLSWRKVPSLRRRIGIVFQDFRLLPRRTIGENVSFVLRALGWPARRRKERTRRVLEWVGLAHRAADWPATLSGGEMQRVAIARALAGEPRILLADEPTGNLDAQRALEILALMREIHARGTTVLVATHDTNLIRQAAARVIRLRAGRLVADEPAA